MKQVDYIVLGQGIAGTCIALELLHRKKSFVIFDPSQDDTPSKITSGLLNPVTGRRFTKTWKWKELSRQALHTYQLASEFTKRDYIINTEVNRIMLDKRQEDHWLERTSLPEYSSYLSSALSPLSLPFIKSGVFGTTYKVKRIEVANLLSDIKSLLTNNKQLINRAVSFEQIDLREKSVGEYVYKHIIDCTGSINLLGKEVLGPTLKPNMGERLIIDFNQTVKIPIYKAKYFFIPIENNRYWIGSYNTWNPNPSAPLEGKEKLIEFVKKWISIDFKVLAHQGGVRMTSTDRRPLVGTNPHIPNVHFINGLGTKGISLAPFCANQLINHIESGSLIDEEISLKRIII